MPDHDNRRPTYDGLLTKSRDPLEIKADAEKGLLTGYASKFWAVDSYGEATAPGAFTKTISERGPAGANRILLRYEHEHTIGTHTAMAEDAAGLTIEAKVSDDGQWGSAVRAHLADGVPYGLSIGFRRISDRSATDEDPLDFSAAPNWVRQLPPEDIRILTGVALMEDSVVSFPAVDQALIDSYRSEPTDIAGLIAAVKAGTLTPEQLTELRGLLTDSSLTAGDDGNTQEAVPRADQTSRRNRYAEAEFLFAQLRQQGIVGAI